jgi:hypothetical protein
LVVPRSRANTSNPGGSSESPGSTFGTASDPRSRRSRKRPCSSRNPFTFQLAQLSTIGAYVTSG